MKILFLCGGNTCRSPLSERIMKKKAEENGLSIETESAGLEAFSGDEASAYTILTAKKMGIDLRNHRSRN